MWSDLCEIDILPLVGREYLALPIGLRAVAAMVLAAGALGRAVLRLRPAALPTRLVAAKEQVADKSHHGHYREETDDKEYKKAYEQEFEYYHSLWVLCLFYNFAGKDWRLGQNCSSMAMRFFMSGWVAKSELKLPSSDCGRAI